MEKVISLNLDSQESAFFSKQLEYIKTQTYDIKLPQLKATTNFPVSFETPSGADTITYQQFDQVGVAKIISDYADDLPRADVLGKEYTSRIRSIGESYGYSIQDIRKSMMAKNTNLPIRKAAAARRANDEKVESIAWNGDTKHGILGVFSNPNISTYTAPNGASPVAPQWGGKTAQEILKDLDDAVTYVLETTNGIEVPDTILLPIAQYRIINTTKVDTGTELTILEYFKRNNPNITRIDWDYHCKDVAPLPSGGAGPADVMLVYKNDPMNLQLEIPQVFEQFPAQERNLEFVIPCHSRCGGVIIYYPLSVLVVEDI